MAGHLIRAHPAAKRLYLVAGRTASGKSTIVNGVCNALGLKQVKSYTTRSPRESELRDADHYFISEDKAVRYKDDIAAYTEINGYKYFTTKAVLDDGDIYVIDPEGIESLKKTCGADHDFVIIYIARRKDLMRQSYCERGETFEAFEKRYSAEDEQFARFEKDEAWDFVIDNNGSIEESVNSLKDIIVREDSWARPDL